MKRLNKEAIDILYEILTKVRKDFPEVKFNFQYHFGMEQYCLIYEGCENTGMDVWQFEELITSDYLTEEINDKFKSIVGVWLDIIEGEVEDDVDILEAEIIFNTYKLKYPFNEN